MELTLSAEQVQLRDAARQLLATRFAALVERLPDPVVHDVDAAVRDAQGLGWLGLGVPEELGGFGTFQDLVVVTEELGRGLAPSLLTTLAVAGRLLLACPAGPTRSDLLARLCAGSVTAAVAHDLAHVPDAGYVEFLVVAAEGRVLAVPVEAVELTEATGFADVPQWGVEPRDLTSAKVLSDDTGVLRDVWTEATVLAAARALGGGRAVLERTVQHVSSREQFGRAIGTFQAVQHQLADVATQLDAVGLAVARAAWAVTAGVGVDEVERAAAVAALTAHQAFAEATLVAHQLHGGMGFVLDSPLHLWSARAVADPSALRGRRHLLDSAAEALGVGATGFTVPAPLRG